MFTIEQRGDQWVVLDGEGEVVSSHDSEDEARREADRLNSDRGGDDENADEDEGPTSSLGGGRRVALDPLFVEDELTTDGRRFTNVAVRETPLPLMFLDREPEGANPHGGAQLAGRIDEIIRLDDGRYVGLATLDDGPAGTEAERVVDARLLRGVSVDAAGGSVDVQIIETNGDGEPTRVEATFDGVEIGGATLVPFPAFRDAQVRLLADDEIPDWGAEEAPADPETDRELAAAGGPVAPPAEWFDDPGFDGPAPLRVTDEGRIFGHVALWDDCHVTFGDRCVVAPRSETGYAYYRTGYVVARRDGGSVEIPTGTITLGTGHAARGLRARAAAEHYDDCGTAVADVAAGEDVFGPWIAGALRPDLSDETIRTLRGSSLSGDWRRVGTAMEMVAVLAVNVPGFAVPRPAATFEDDRAVTLVAAGMVDTGDLPCGCGDADLEALSARLAAVETVTAPLRALSAERLAERLGRP